MTKDEALHKALKVLNCLNNDRVYETAWVKGAINACEEALEQPTTQEPVASRFKLSDGNYSLHNDQYDFGEPLYTHPKQWQGLSDDEIWNIANFLGKNKEWDYPVMFAKTIEQALKEKNHE